MPTFKEIGVYYKVFHTKYKIQDIQTLLKPGMIMYQVTLARKLVTEYKHNNYIQT